MPTMKRLIGEPTFLQNPALQFESLILNKFTVSTELSQWLFVTNFFRFFNKIRLSGMV